MKPKTILIVLVCILLVFDIMALFYVLKPTEQSLTKVAGQSITQTQSNNLQVQEQENPSIEQEKYVATMVVKANILKKE